MANRLVSILQDRALELQDPASSKCCADCLYAISKLLSDNALLDAACQPVCHDFWNACIATVTTPRTDDDIATLRNTLRANSAKCPARNVGFHSDVSGDSEYNGELQDPVQRFIHALYQCLVHCVSPSEGRRARSALFSASGPKKTFGHRRGRWPTHPNDLIPFGERQSMEMHIYWLSQLFSPTMVFYLKILVLGCRPLVFPHVLESPLRERLAWCFVQMFNADTARDTCSWPATVKAARPARLSSWLCALQLHMSVDLAGGLVNVISDGPDANSDDTKRLFAGFEAAMLPALNNTLDLCQKDSRTASDQARESLCQLAIDLRKQYPRWNEELHVLARTWHEERSRVSASTLEPTKSALNRRYFRRTCYGPSCTSGITVTQDGKPLPLCSSCKFTQYCCKGCQMADWKRAPLPHKDLCPILRSLRPVLEKDTGEFEDVLLGLDWDELKMKQFMLWLKD